MDAGENNNNYDCDRRDAFDFFAAELAMDGITCDAICPGYFYAELTTDVLDTDTFQQFAKTHVPMQRYGKEGELNATAVFLASEEASYVTGVILPVDGGYTAI